jgi:hypothetical protein
MDLQSQISLMLHHDRQHAADARHARDTERQAPMPSHSRIRGPRARWRRTDRGLVLEWR